MSKQTLYNQQYRKKYPEKSRQARKRYYQTIKLNGKSKAYRISISYRFNKYKYNAKKKKYIFEITKIEFQNIVCQPCFYCGTTLKIGMDRFDNNLGYIKSNIVACCKDCNMTKRRLDGKVFINLCQKVATHMGLRISN